MNIAEAAGQPPLQYYQLFELIRLQVPVYKKAFHASPSPSSLVSLPGQYPFVTLARNESGSLNEVCGLSLGADRGQTPPEMIHHFQISAAGTICMCWPLWEDTSLPQLDGEGKPSCQNGSRLLHLPHTSKVQRKKRKITSLAVGTTKARWFEAAE